MIDIFSYDHIWYIICTKYTLHCLFKMKKVLFSFLCLLVASFGQKKSPPKIPETFFTRVNQRIYNGVIYCSLFPYSFIVCKAQWDKLIAMASGHNTNLILKYYVVPGEIIRDYTTKQQLVVQVTFESDEPTTHDWQLERYDIGRFFGFSWWVLNAKLQTLILC